MDADPLQVQAHFLHILTEVQIVDTQHILRYATLRHFYDRQISYLDSTIAWCHDHLSIPFTIHNPLKSKMMLVAISNILSRYSSQIIVLYTYCYCYCCCHSPFFFLFCFFSSPSSLLPLPLMLLLWHLHLHRRHRSCWDYSPDQYLVLLLSSFACFSHRRPACLLVRYFMSQKHIIKLISLIGRSLSFTDQGSNSGRHLLLSETRWYQVDLLTLVLLLEVFLLSWNKNTVGMQFISFVISGTVSRYISFGLSQQISVVSTSTCP